MNYLRIVFSCIAVTQKRTVMRRADEVPLRPIPRHDLIGDVESAVIPDVVVDVDVQLPGVVHVQFKDQVLTGDGQGHGNTLEY